MIFFMKFILAIVAVLFLPGYLVNLVLFKGRKFDILETMPYSFGSSMVLHLIIALFIFVSQLNITSAFMLFIASMSFLGIFILKDMKSQHKGYIFLKNMTFIPENKELVIAIPALLSLSIILYMGYYIEAQPSYAVEDANILVMAQNILGRSSLNIDSLLYKPKVVYPYIIPIYSYVLALLSYISNLEIIQIYSKIRFVFSLITISAIYALSRLLFPKIKELPWFVVLIACATLWSGWGYNYGTGVFGQFFPYPIYQDFALYVVLPVCFLLFIRGLTEEGRYLLISFLLTVSLMFIHARGVVILLIIYTANLFGLFVLRRDRTMLLKGLSVIGGITLISLLMKMLQANLMDPNLLKFTADFAEIASKKIYDFVNSPSLALPFYPPLEDDGQFFSGFNLTYLNPYYLFSLFLLPLFFYMRKEASFTILFYSMFLPVVIASIPILSLLVIKFTYPQVLWGGVAYFSVFHIFYIILALFLWGVFQLIARFQGFIKLHFFKAIISLLFIVLFSIHLPQWIYKFSPFAFYLYIFAAPLVILNTRWFKKEVPEFSQESLLKKENYLLIPIAILFLLFLASYGTSVSGVKLQPDFKQYNGSASLSVQPFYKVFKAADGNTSVTDWEAWYRKSNYKAIPLQAVYFIRKQVPEGKIFAAPYIKYSGMMLNLAVLTGQFIYTSESYTTQLEIDFLERLYRLRFNENINDLVNDGVFLGSYLRDKNPGALKEDKATQKHLALLYIYDDLLVRQQPVFNDFDTPQTTLNLIRLFKIEYILVTPDWHPHIEKVFSALKEHIEKIYDKDLYAIYKLRK